MLTIERVREMRLSQEEFVKLLNSDRVKINRNVLEECATRLDDDNNNVLVHWLTNELIYTNEQSEEEMFAYTVFADIAENEKRDIKITANDDPIINELSFCVLDENSELLNDFELADLIHEHLKIKYFEFENDEYNIIDEHNINRENN